MSENRRRRRSDIPPQYEESAPQSNAAYTAPRHAEYASHYTPSAHENIPSSTAQPMIVNQIGIASDLGFGNQSYFDGGLLSLIGWSILASLLIIFTLGLGYPFAACMLYKWEARHTIINGRRLRFDGNGWQLIGKWILWVILTIITLGIYSFWLVIKLKQWRIKHTHFA